MTNLQTMTLHGDRVAYRDEGAGEVLLLIHGMGGSSFSWRAVIPQLAKKYRVIAPDLLGHGESDKPRGDYSLGAFAVWLRDLLDALDIPKATVVGHSLGGGVAMQFAHQHRDYCQRLVLISSGGLGNDVGRLLRLLSLPGAELVLPRIRLTAGGQRRQRASSPNVLRPRGHPVQRNLPRACVAVQPAEQAGVPANAALGRRPPRPVGMRTESPAVECGSACNGHLR